MTEAHQRTEQDARFPDGLGAVVQWTVAREELPALIVIHDSDGDWLIGDGVNDPNEAGACGIVHIRQVANVDPTVEQTATLPPGHYAHRPAGDQPWTISPWRYPSESAADLASHPDARA